MSLEVMAAIVPGTINSVKVMPLGQFLDNLPNNRDILCINCCFAKKREGSRKIY